MMGRKRDLDLVEDELSAADELEELVEGARARAVVGFFSGLMLGLALGAGVALILAPERGVVLRRRLRAQLQDVRDDAKEQFDDMRDGAGREVRRQRQRLRRRLRRRRS
jgi:hypothetical protein